MSIPQAESAKQASIISITTRQPMEPSKPKRGGKRDPLPRLTITTPNYGKYQHDIKGRREWVAMYGAMRHSRQIRRLEQGQRWSFCVLLMIADNDGRVIETTAKELAFEFGCENHRAAQRAIEAMAEVGLIQVESKSVSSPVQVESKLEASSIQVESKSAELEQSASDAVQGAHTTDNGQLTTDSKKSKEKKKRLSVADMPQDFQRFWSRYLNPTDLRETWEVWQEMAPDEAAQAEIHAGLDRWLSSKRWAEGYIKAPHRWLRDGMWREYPQQAAVSRDELQATKDEFAAMFGTF